MSAAYLLYNMAVSVGAPPLLAMAVASNRMRGHWRERLGFVPRLRGGGRARVWVHAVSFGEVQVAAALIFALKKQAPDLTVCLSTSTNAGRVAVREFLKPDIPVLTFPLDIYGSPNRALKRLRPDLLILIETEIWPNLLKTARSMGVRTMLANGRITVRAAARYRRFGFLFREVLGFLDCMAMIQAEHRDRIISLGADPSKVVVTGSAKYDQLISRADPLSLRALREELGLSTDQPVLVAGSTRTGEEAMVLDVFERLRQDFPRLHLILAPRHVDRAGEIEALIRDHNQSFRRWSDQKVSLNPPADVTLVDVMGELFTLYGLADVAFCGGSLVPLGGHNPLEVATWARPVLYGPFMDNFLDAKEMLEAVGAGQTASTPDELFHKIKELLSDPEQARSRGRAGREALKARPSSADRMAKLAVDLLPLEKNKIVPYT
ncbi:MAG: 3-deoxy-D-manno-octulosonic acid transferase [Deltaproteobacteria bacterium]|nr:3-deoxy-D-manno-octulosonic acid transferase [Deltaproteobacteria bacterium]